MKNGKDENDKTPDFPNDQVTDWVIHQEAEPGREGDELANEPEDVEENASLPRADAGDKGPADCWFPIHFNYQGIDHTADVLKKEGAIREYHVTSVSPAIPRLPDPFIVASTLSKDAYDFPVNEDYYPRALGLVIKKAIGSGCDLNDVALA